MATVLQKYCESAIATFQSQVEATKLIPHNVSAGSVREQLVRDFLADHLPQLVTIMSGQIFDSQDNFSKQQDVVAVMKSMPRLPFASGQDLIYREAVVATIEVKTTLHGAALEAACSNIASVNALQSVQVGTTSMSVTHSWPPARILTAIVAYAGMSTNSILQALSSIPLNSLPDLILDLGTGLLVRNHGLLLGQQGATMAGAPVPGYLIINNAAEGFKYFLTFLTEITGTHAARGVPWRSYC